MAQRPMLEAHMVGKRDRRAIRLNAKTQVRNQRCRGTRLTLSQPGNEHRWVRRISAAVLDEAANLLHQWVWRITKAEPAAALGRRRPCRHWR